MSFRGNVYIHYLIKGNPKKYFREFFGDFCINLQACE